MCPVCSVNHVTSLYHSNSLPQGEREVRLELRSDDKIFCRIRVSYTDHTFLARIVEPLWVASICTYFPGADVFGTALAQILCRKNRKGKRKICRGEQVVSRPAMNCQ